MLHDITASFAPPRPMREKFPEVAKFENLSHFIVRAAAIEFAVVADVAGATSVAYDFAVGRAPSAAWRYAAPAVAIATLVLAVSLALRHYATLQTQPLHRFLWNGLAAAGVAVSLLLAALFLLKVSDDYSRATFLAQSAVVTVAVLAMRATLHARVRSALAAGRIEARRAVLLGETRRRPPSVDVWRRQAYGSSRRCRCPKTLSTVIARPRRGGPKPTRSSPHAGRRDPTTS